MANKVTIDVEARFIDNVTDEARAAAKSFDTLEKSAESTQKELKEIGKTKVKPKVDLDSNSAARKLDAMDKKLNKFGKSRTEAKLSVLDKATATIDKVTSKAKAFAGKTYSGLVKIRDSNVLNSLSKMSSGLKSLTSKAWTTVVKIKDTFTAPLTKLKNMLFNVKTLIAGIASAWAATQLIGVPVNLADQYTSAKIGFSTLLGESRGKAMMDEIDSFAAATPFKTSNVISNVQKMMAYGWDAEKVIDDMKIIGDAAAATGKGDEGLGSIVYALSEIRSKGKLSTQELNQLASAGIKAKQYLAQGLGYGTDDAGLMKLSKDLEAGAIGANQAVELILEGMKEFDGMMDKTANETIKGLKDQLADLFEINVFRKWGQGLQDGFKRGLGSIVSLLDDAGDVLGSLGDLAYDVGKKISNWLADKLEIVINKVKKITDTFEFANADLGGKISMLWKGLVADPLGDWWKDSGRDKTIAVARDIGTAIGKAIFEGISIAWEALPWWGKLLVGGYGVGKVAGGIANFAGGITKFLGSSGSIGAGNVITGASGLLGVLGKTGVYGGVGSSGILGGLAKTGWTLMGGTSALSMSGGTAALIGGGSIAGGIAAAAGLGHSIKTGYDAYQGFKEGDKTKGWANVARSGTTLAGVAAGAALGAKAGTAIGAMFGGVGAVPGALIGAGIGAVGGWLLGDTIAKNIEAARYESEELKAAIKDSDLSAEELNKEFEKAKWENARKHFGDIELSMSEIAALSKEIVWGDDLTSFEQFSTSVQAAEESMKAMKTASESINRWMWKGGLGVKFTTDEIESIKQSFTEYITSAKNLLENTHYEWSAAVSLFVDVQSEDGKSILNSGNAFYGGLKKELSTLETGLNDTLDKVLKDGVISNEDKVTIKIRGVEMEVSEAEALQAYYAAIAEVTSMIANAEAEAEMALIKVKFASGNLDSESFSRLMSQMQTTIDERMQANDEAFVASVTGLKLELEHGTITPEEYNRQLQTLIDGYTGTVETLQAQVKDVELEIIAEAYNGADALGADAMDDLNRVLQHAADKGIDPIEISDEQMANLLNIELDGNGETISNIRDYLNGVFSHMKLLEVDGDLLIKVGEVRTTGDLYEVDNFAEVLKEELGIPDEQAYTLSLLLTADKEILETIDTTWLAKELGVPEDVAETIITKLTGEKCITPEDRVEVLGTDLVSATEVWQTITVNLKAKVGQVADKIKSFFGGAFSADGEGYRGGIFGGSFAQGGIVGGSTRFIRVNEESPEMIIPLSDQRRGRALKLWAQAGNIMGVPGFARGGIVGGGGSDEGIRFNTYDSDDSASGRTVQVNMGGVKLEINVNGSDRESIVEAIKAQAGDLADYIAGVIADSLETEFENTPVRGGVA